MLPREHEVQPKWQSGHRSLFAVVRLQRSENKIVKSNSLPLWQEAKKSMLKLLLKMPLYLGSGLFEGRVDKWKASGIADVRFKGIMRKKEDKRDSSIVSA